MQILQSTIVWNLPQVDGRSIVRELHIDDQGNQYTFDYVLDKNANVNLHLTNDAATLNAQFLYNTNHAVAIATTILNNLNTQIAVLQAEALSEQQIISLLPPDPIVVTI